MFRCSGMVHRWDFVTKANSQWNDNGVYSSDHLEFEAGDIISYASVWREIQTGTYQLIGKNKFQADGENVIIYVLLNRENCKTDLSQCIAAFILSDTFTCLILGVLVPYFGFLMAPPLGFKARVGSALFTLRR